MVQNCSASWWDRHNIRSSQEADKWKCWLPHFSFFIQVGVKVDKLVLLKFRAGLLFLVRPIGEGLCRQAQNYTSEVISNPAQLKIRLAITFLTQQGCLPAL